MAKITTKVAAKMDKATTKAKAAKVTPIAPKANAFNNPYRVGGGYWASVEALRTLGVGKMHSFDAILPAVRKAMGDKWKPFAAKGGKLTADERAMMNVMVTSRKDYGLPLVENAGYEVRWDGRAKVAGLYKVGTPAPKVASKPQTAVKATDAKGKGKTAPKASTPQKAGKGK